MSRALRYWAVVPAAGAGRRMGISHPKQYLRLGGKTVIEHSLDALFAHPLIAGAAVAIAAGDSEWEALEPAYERLLLRAQGGAERSDSVLSALELLSAQADAGDWVLVHDAARPCLREQDLSRLIAEVGEDPVGGLLAIPVRDTMKHADAGGRAEATLAREHIWHALTPQMFRLGALREALTSARKLGVAVTDEAAAMELAGHRPRLVEGHADNIKITRPEDLALAEFYLREHGRL